MSGALGFLAGVPCCPHLPVVHEPLDHAVTRRHGRDRGAAFYQDALAYAHSQWLCGKPAQALLQLNKAWTADHALPATLLRSFPPPYRALVWMMHAGSHDAHGFLGNPVRHFQHLATRVSGPQTALRSSRAWVCFHLARRSLAAAWYPPDARQLAREGLWLPPWSAAVNRVRTLGWPGEAAAAMRALDDTNL